MKLEKIRRPKPKLKSLRLRIRVLNENPGEFDGRLGILDKTSYELIWLHDCSLGMLRITKL